MAKVRYLTTNEAANRLRCHPKTIQKMLRSGILAGFKIPDERGAWRIPETAIQRLENLQ